MKSESLRANIKLTLYRALTDLSLPFWEFAADSHHLILQCLKNIICTNGNLPRYIPISDLHVAFKIVYTYDLVTKLFRQ